ncbi:hypothetical protein [Streptomyces fumanus]|uniref:Integrase n=1 Tax=Streptomyces fumanus TaxID=67302 RepID=A0A919E0Q8_9ACTN|nr:hypothetical protein [Streptomyces fumanus]GHF07030.1 hypothetical protein GCM10018772_34990 [Streptomyces fumanus]
MEQAVRDGIIEVDPARVTGWQKLYKRAQDELLNPRALALPDWETLLRLAYALVAASYDHYRAWGDVVLFAACTAARIGEVSGCRIADIDTDQWVWTVQRQTTPAPGGLTDKGTKGGLTWFADAGVPVHVLRHIAGHGSLVTTQRYLHPDVRSITAAGTALSAHLTALRAPRSLPSPIVMTR